MKGMEGATQVYHLAAFAKVWDKNPNVYQDINVKGSIAVADAAVKEGVEKLVFTSTAGVFGDSENGLVTESIERKRPFFNEYESTKKEAEDRLLEFASDKLKLVIVNPTRIYGPLLNSPAEAVNLLIQKFTTGQWRLIPGDGSKIGNYVYIDDVINGHLLAMEKGEHGHNYILGGENHDYNSFFNTLKEISGTNPWMMKMPNNLQMAFAKLQMLKPLVNKEPLITPGWIAKGYYHWEVSSQKAERQLGYQITPLREGIKKTVEVLLGNKPSTV